MDVTSLSSHISPASRMIPHITPASTALNHGSQCLQRLHQQEGENGDEGELASPVHPVTLSFKMASAAGAAQSMDRQMIVGHNGFLDRNSFGRLKDSGLGVDQDNNLSSDLSVVQLSSGNPGIGIISHKQCMGFAAEAAVGLEEEEEMSLGCVKCGQDFHSMQDYVHHSCHAHKTPSSAVTRDFGVEGDVYGGDLGADKTEGYQSDVETFNGKIVYNPDGSAYIIEGSDSEDSDVEGLDVPKLEGAIVDRKGLTTWPSAPPIPQIASAVFVPKNPSGWSNILRTSSSDSVHGKSQGAPVMHSFRVHDVRRMRGAGGSNYNLTLGSRGSGPQSDEPLAKPILMCFICKLSFGYAKSFLTHATGEHNMDLIEAERTIISRPGASAIIQGVGKEKEPLMSFLEPLQLPLINKNSCTGSGFATDVNNMPFFFPTASSTPVSKSQTAPTKVSYVYTKPKMSKDVTHSPASEHLDQHSDDSCSKVPTDFWHAPCKDQASTPSSDENSTEHDANRPCSGARHTSSKNSVPSPRPADTSSPHSDTEPSNGEASKQDGSEPVCGQEPVPISSTSLASLAGGHLGFFGSCDEHPQGRSQDIECPKCDMVLTSSQSLGGHLTMMHSRNSCKTLKCPKCNWHYKYQETLEIHMKEKHPDNDAQCFWCMRNEPHPRLARGETYSCGYKPYRCEVCNYSTTTKGNLSIHMQSDKHMNNMQELANGSTEMKLPGTSNHSSSGQSKPYPEDVQFKKLKPKQPWRCEVCNYETMVARNLRIHITSEKHTHNMMVLQQNVKHMQRDMQIHMNQLIMMGQQDPSVFGLPNLLNPGMYPYDQSMLVPGTPPGFDIPMGMAHENGAPPEEVIMDMSDASKLFQCCICNQHFTDSLDALHQHLQLDRTKQRESENISISNGTYVCNLCTYKTNLKANFQLHCKTDKHIQRLQMVNHIKEGGPENEWKLGFINASNPTQVRCNACNFYTSSVHKLQVHASSIQHESNATVFRLLQLALMRLQASLGTNSIGRYYYRCTLCECNVRTKQTMVHHARTLKHIQREQAGQLTLDPQDIFVAVTLHDGENITYEYDDDVDGEERIGDSSYNPDGILDTESKVEFSGNVTPSSAAVTTSACPNIANNPSTVTSTSLARSVESDAGFPSQSETDLPGQHNGPQEKPVTGLEHTKASVGSSSSLEPSGQTSGLLCPLCQDACLGLDDLDEHLSQSHKVTPEGRQRLLLMVDIPPAMPTLVPGSEINGKDGGSSTAPSAGTLEAKSSAHSIVVTASSPPLAVAPPAVNTPTPVFSIDETEVLDVDKLEREHHRLVTEDAIEVSVQSEKPELAEEYYRCQTCAKSFVNIDQLYAHQNELGHLELKQTPRGPGYLCWKKGCNQYFKTAQALQVHFREIHARRNSLVTTGEQPSQVLRCSQCYLAFRSESRLQDHRQYHLAVSVTQCSICQAAFSSVQGLRSHLKMYHSDLSQSESENLQKTIDLNLSVLCSTPGCDRFFAYYLGVSPKIHSRNAPTPATDGGYSTLQEDLIKEKNSEAPVSKLQTVDNEAKSGNSFSSRDVEFTSGDSIKMRMKELAEKIEREDEEADQLELLKQSFPDQQSLEDFINSQAMAEGNYEDPSRKFKCHRCKAGFTKQSYLTAHNKTQLHRRGDKVNYSVDRYLDPNRPFKCDVCKESFTQKNILMVHQNSVSHLHKVKQAVQFSTSGSAASSQIQHLLNEQPAHTNGKTISSKNSTEKKPYQCNLCKVGFGQSEPFENHLHSVGHQSRLAKIPELVMSGQISLTQNLIEQPDLPIDPQAQHLFMEALQQQHQLAAVTSQSLLFQALPTLNSLPLMGMPQLLPPATTSLISPTTAALASFASAMAMESELNSHRYFSAEGQIGDVRLEAHKEPSGSRQMVDLEQQTVETHDGKKETNDSAESTAMKLGVNMKEVAIKKEVEEMDETRTTEFAEMVASHYHHGQKVDVGVGQQVGRMFDLQASNPTLAASIPIMTSRPRGFMGRFKPQVHRSLLENIGFECVMQFNEYSQIKRKEKEKEKDQKESGPEGVAESMEKNGEQTGMPAGQELVAREEDKQSKVDLPEINKSKCLSCGKEFSSVFVLKAHEEEVHKNVVPISFVEDFGEKFKTDFEKKQPKSEPEMVPASTQSFQVLQAPPLPPPPPPPPPASVSISTAVEKAAKAGASDMPPPPPPPQLSSAAAFDMTQMMPMLSLMPMPVPMNLMSLGIQPPLMPMMAGTAIDMPAGFLPQLGMTDPGIMSAQQQMQVAAAAAAAQNQKRVRTRISDEQLKILRAHFDINNSPSEEQINQMSEQSGLPQKVIKHWFRNTLFKERQRNKDSPYNFNNPPSTTIDLEEYEKTGRIPAIKVEPSDEDDEVMAAASSGSVSRPEGQEGEPDPKLPLQLTTKVEILPKFEPVDERKEQENRSNASTPSNMSSIPTTPTCSAPPTPTPTAAPTRIIDAHAAAQARETAAQSSLTKRANRTRFTDYQIKMLQEYFEQNAYPKDDELDHLSKLLNLSPRVIVVWFQNARQKARKIFENQPAAADVKEGNSPFQRTPSLNYQCKRCSAVFQRYYELIKHQKQPCLSENNNNKPLNSTLTDDDSISSSTSLDESVLSDSMPITVPKDIVLPSVVPAFQCDKCSAAFNHADLLQEHHKVHDMNPSLFPPFSSTSAFGMLQSLAQQEDSKSVLNAACTSAKRKLEMEEERAEDQPKDKRLRTTILPEQLDYLYQKYQIDCNPSRKQLETIAQEVRLKKRVVQVWFQNTRARERKGHYRAHQQLIHKRCPFCRALFRAKSALESHLATKHPEEMAKGEINVDSIPDAAMESPQPAHSLPGSSATQQPLAADLSKILSPNSMQPYFTYMPPAGLSMGFPPAMSPDPLQLSMKQIYEESYKDYISKLSGSAHPPKSSHVPEPPTPSRYSEPEKRVPAATNDEDAPLDLSISVKSSSSNNGDSSSSSSKTLPPNTSFTEKLNRDYERDRNRHSSFLDDSFSETQSEVADSEYQGDMGSSPPSPRASSGGAMQNKRYRTQMTSLQVRVMKTLFVDYKTPTMAECELLGREIGLPKRVVQVWFQNARAKEKKSKLAMAKTYCSDVDFPKTAEECTLCKFTYSHKFTVQDHIFTKRHIDNVKSYIQSQSEAEREVSDPSSVSGLLRQQSRDLEVARKIWDKSSPTSSHLAQLQGLNAATAFGLSTSIPGLGSLPLMSELGASSTSASGSGGSSSSSKKTSKDEESHSKDKKSEASASSSKEHHQQQHQQQQAAELAHMMALGGYLPSLDPAYFSFMYSCLPGYFPSMAAMPLLQPGLLPGAEHLMAYDPLSFGTPLPQLQIPAQAIKHVSEKLTESGCTLAQYTQDCKSLSDLKSMVSTADFACAREAAVDVGYICKKCQMVYPAREACLTHQRTLCYVMGGESSKTMLKLEQVQYECRACSDKFSTLYEFKLHCQLDAHALKIGKLGMGHMVSASPMSSKPSFSLGFPVMDLPVSYSSASGVHGGGSSSSSKGSSHTVTSSSAFASRKPPALTNSIDAVADKNQDAKRAKLD